MCIGVQSVPGYEPKGVLLFRAFCVGGLDMNTRVYGAEKFENLIIYSMGGHRDAIVGCFFEEDSLDVSFCVEYQT